MHFCIKSQRIKIIIQIRTYFLLYIWSEMLALSRYVLLKLSETTSPQKLFPSDCITLYIKKIIIFKKKEGGFNTFKYFKNLNVILLKQLLCFLHSTFLNLTKNTPYFFLMKHSRCFSYFFFFFSI